MKPRNILYRANSDPLFALGDFGLCRRELIDESEIVRPMAPDPEYTSGVVTLFYRAPEIILSSGKYTAHIDDWALGCSFAEVEISEPLFKARTKHGCCIACSPILAFLSIRSRRSVVDLEH